MRINYDTAPGGYWAGGRPSWSHGYPVAERNLMKIMNELSYLGARDDEFNTLALEDPELFKYPVAYIIEVGWWTLTDHGAGALRDYLLKGGFLIVDDFKAPGWRGIPGAGWEPFETNMRRVLPGVRFFDMAGDAPDLSQLLRDQRARQLSAGLQRRPADLPGRVRRQRSEQAPARHRQLQHGHLAVLGVVRPGPPAVR